MSAVFRLFPWDVEGHPGAAAALAERGVTRVALAATYHGARVATPRHPLHRVIEIGSSAAYVDGVPALPRGAWSYARAKAALEAAGIAVDAWIVLGHPDGVQPALPRVVNAFGDRLSHALCLTAPESRAFVTSVAVQALAAVDTDTAWIEAPGWLGFAHGSLHEKTAGADYSAHASRLLGICVCGRCLTAAGVEDVDTARGEVRAAVDAGFDPAWLERLQIIRDEAADALRTETEAAAREHAIDLCFSAEDLRQRHPGTVYVGCWGAVDAAEAALAASAHHGRRAAYVSILEDDPTGFAERWRRLAAAGADELHIYHAGLASDDRLDAAVAAAAAFDARSARLEHISVNRSSLAQR